MTADAARRPRVLVIKLGALGDVVQALGPMRAIRKHHADSEISLLTSAPFEALLRQAGVADRIIIDPRPAPLQIGKWLELRRLLRSGGFSVVYDLQTSGRSGRYFKLFWPDPAPAWSGIAPGCALPHANPARDDMHTLARQAEQLSMAGIADVPAPSLDGIGDPIDGFALPAGYCALLPGGAQHRPDKRWPLGSYIEIARRLAAADTPCAVLGGADEQDLAAAIAAAVPGTAALAGKTSLTELVSVLRGARFALGNDTGPMHIAAALGVPSVVLYSAASDPALCAQRGPAVEILRRQSLGDLTVDEVWAALPQSTGPARPAGAGS